MTMMSARATRHLQFETLFNARDMGGYKARAGQRVKWQRLYRADCLGRASRQDLIALGDLDIRTVIDLRTDREALAEPPGVFPGRFVDVHRFPLLDETWDERQLGLQPGQDEVGFLVERYLDMLVQGAPAIVDALGVLALPSAYPLVFHCALGKDRTGLLAAVVLALLGVDDKTIAADYALSGPAVVRYDAWLLARHPAGGLTTVNVPPAFLVSPPEAMLRVLAQVRERCGSMIGFARGIGVPFDVIEELHRQLLD